MSLIHCSPLFLPLEPLPVMGPATMRRYSRDSSSKHSTSGSSSVALPRSSTTGPASAVARRKRTAAVRRASHPLAKTPVTMPASDPMPPSVSTSLSLPEDLSPTVNANSEVPSQEVLHDSWDYETSVLTASESTSQELQLCSAYQDDCSFESQVQGFLTFTVESQPMSDLSSSQQQTN